MVASKSEMVSVRVGPQVKAALQTAARQELRSVANMVEVMVLEYCRNQGYVFPQDSSIAKIDVGPRDPHGA